MDTKLFERRRKDLKHIKIAYVMIIPAAVILMIFHEHLTNDMVKYSIVGGIGYITGLICMGFWIRCGMDNQEANAWLDQFESSGNAQRFIGNKHVINLLPTLVERRDLNCKILKISDHEVRIYSPGKMEEI